METKKTLEIKPIQDAAIQVHELLSKIEPIGPVERRYLETAKRDIATGFMWAERSITGYTPG